MPRRVCTSMFEEPFDSGNERRQIVIDRGLNDGMRCVEVPMRQVITHSGNVTPRYLRLQGQQVWRNRSHRLADLDEADSDCIETPSRRRGCRGAGGR